ncbi:MAG TPA: hypothetical protein VH853_03780 [Polyangia bacterium]|jgi:hypothetical protein|nr:hypothetical protein [Polyangia bacterium]
MRITGAFVLALSLGVAAVATGTPSYAKGKGKKKGGGEGSAPAASAKEVDKLKAVRLGDPDAGTFKWGMKPEEVMASVRVSLEGKYKKRIEEASQDPGKQQRVRDEMIREINAVKKSFTKFEGQKSGWDVSIVGPEFQQGTSEAVLVTKEEAWTRYFFFFDNGLYKMYLAFNKDALQGKSFADFGKNMESRYGNARAVYRDEKTKAGVDHVLDHFAWTAGGDRLKLVDRSEFYGVYCLVLYEQATHERVVEKRNVVNPGTVEKDELVEAVATRGKDGNDENDDIIDRVVGHETKKPGTEEHADIVVPSTSGRAVSPSEVNSKSGSSGSSSSSSESKKKASKKSNDNPMDGLEL